MEVRQVADRGDPRPKVTGTDGPSLQVDRGIRDVLQSDELFNCKPAINRAYHFARDKSFARVGDKQGRHYLEFKEFRLFLKALRQYFEYFQAFDT